MKIKICGMTREEDVELALSLGADFLGFIVYPKSPRGISLARAEELAAVVPEGKRVIVDVETSPDDLRRYCGAGFDRFQIHASLPLDEQRLGQWSEIALRDRLWLAPRVSPTDVFPESVLSDADTILLDTYSKDQVGGTGHTGDFERFAGLKQQFEDTQWILAGGLNPSNVLDAVRRSTTTRVDVNSGVESAPGIKNPEKLRELFRVLREA
ncbi:MULTISPECIES: phosphoribosylanthranilate isomerase [unclassified Lentimonas]|uniref:phosphoribosylanthranilate isomerase n=1 Tax=unclassified Lentimonas TaxID=2630993 RepID=UPI00138A218C|nr:MULTISPECIES: phosphoribosylanthranilate isomerase [unclassified Lentimonas]